MIEFTKRVEASRQELLRLARGHDNGNPTWYYVKIDKDKFPIYQARLKRGESVNVRDYGTVLHCGWGENPPAEITSAVLKEFAA